jgi:RNA polymerase sigma-70 factor (ECF subfamily)
MGGSGRYSGCTDDELLQSARKGEDAAFALLLARHRLWVYRLVQAIVQDAEQAEDLTQDTFCRVYRHLDDYNAQERFIPWLKRIALNLARNHLRDRRRYQEHLTTLPYTAEQTRPDPLTDPASALTSRLLQEEVRTALEALGPEHREVMALHYFAGLNVEAIAQQMACPVGTVKSRLFHARRQLRQTLSPNHSPFTGEEPDENGLSAQRDETPSLPSTISAATNTDQR